jgi:hypothetical protein
MSFGGNSTPPVKPKKAPKVVTKKQTHDDQEAAKKAARVAKRQSSTLHNLLSAKADGVVGAPSPTKSYATTVLGGSGAPKAGF